MPTTRAVTKQRPKRRGSNMFQKLPWEILREIIILLDCFSLRSLLEAYNDDLKDMFLVVTDTVYKNTPLLFFHGLHLKTIRFKDFVPRKWSREQPLIKIFELVDTWETQTADVWDNRDERYGVGKVHPFMDGHSIVYINSILSFYHTQRKTDTAVRSGVSHVNTDWIGFEPHEIVFGPRIENESKGNKGKRSSYTPVLKGQPGWTRFKGSMAKGLRTLRIQYTDVIENLKFDSLEKLTVFFGTGEGNDHAQPTIRKLKAPHLSFFAIHYHDKLPQLENIEVGDEMLPRINTAYFENPLQFRLIQVDALNRVRSKPWPMMAASAKLSVRNSDFAFTKNYESIHIIGGPDELIEMMDFSSCIDLVWRQTHIQDHPGDRAHQITEIKCPMLTSFTFDTLLNDIYVPQIITSKPNELTYLNVITYALGTKVHQALRNNMEGLHSLSVHCWGFPSSAEEAMIYPPLYMDLAGNNEYDDLKALKRISVMGYCQFGDAPDRSDEEVYQAWVTELIAQLKRARRRNAVASSHKIAYWYGFDTLASPEARKGDLVMIPRNEKLHCPRPPAYKGKNRKDTTRTPGTERLAPSRWLYEHQ